MNEDNVESVDGTSRTDMLAMLNRLHIKDQEIIRIKNEKEQEIIRIQNEKDQEIIRLKNEKDQEIIMLRHENECLKIKLKFPKEEKQKVDIFNILTMPSKSKGGKVKISQMDPVPVVGIISATHGNKNQIPQSVNHGHGEQEQTQWSYQYREDQDNCSSFDFYNDGARDNGSSHPFCAGGTQESPSSLKFIRNNGTWKMGNEQGEKKSKRSKRKKNKGDKKIKKFNSPRHGPAQYENNTNNLEENPKENNNISKVPFHKMDTEDELNNIIRKQVSVPIVPPVHEECLKIKLKLPKEEKQKLKICNNLTMPSQSKGGNPEDQESGRSQSFYAGGAQESQSPRGFYTDDACEPAPKLPIISPVDIWKQHNAQQKNPRTISVEEFEDVATFPQSEIIIKTEVMYDESGEIVPNQENGENTLDTSFCEEVVPSRKNTYGPEWTMMQPNLLELKQEEGSCTDEQNKAVELMAVSHGGGAHKKIKVYNCSLCDREMTNASSIVSHIQSKHGEGGKKKMRCIFPLCEHSAYREDLIRHIRAKHTKEELFECKKCSKKFYTYRAMKDHVENHRYQDMCRKCNRFYRHDKCGFCKDSM